MWGSTFADLAKQAQEAAEKASALSGASGLFSLDSMQEKAPVATVTTFFNLNTSQERKENIVKPPHEVAPPAAETKPTEQFSSADFPSTIQQFSPAASMLHQQPAAIVPTPEVKGTTLDSSTTLSDHIPVEESDEAPALKISDPGIANEWDPDDWEFDDRDKEPPHSMEVNSSSLLMKCEGIASESTAAKLAREMELEAMSSESFVNVEEPTLPNCHEATVGQDVLISPVPEPEVLLVTKPELIEQPIAAVFTGLAAENDLSDVGPFKQNSLDESEIVEPSISHVVIVEAQSPDSSEAVLVVEPTTFQVLQPEAAALNIQPPAYNEWELLMTKQIESIPMLLHTEADVTPLVSQLEESVLLKTEPIESLGDIASDGLDDMYDDDDDMYDDEQEGDDESVQARATSEDFVIPATATPDDYDGLDISPSIVLHEDRITPVAVSPAQVTDEPDTKYHATQVQTSTISAMIVSETTIPEPTPGEPEGKDTTDPILQPPSPNLEEVPHLIEKVQAEVRNTVVTLESETVDVTSDTGTLLTVAPKSDQGKPQDMFNFSTSTPAASSLFGYMMSAVPFSDRSEATLETSSLLTETVPQHTSDSTFITSQAVEASNITDLPKPNDSVTNKNLIPVSILDTYAVQMQRMQDYHHSEIQELRMEYEKQLKEKTQSTDHDACVSERNLLSERFIAKLREKEEQMQEIMRMNEGLELKIDSLKRELAGTNNILNEKEKSIGSASAARDKELKTMEQKMKELRTSEGTAKADINQLRDQLKAARAEIESADEAYGALKARVKVVATELKDRRAECRTIGLTLGEMTEANEQLQIKLKFYESQLGDRDRNQTEKDEEMDHLKDKVKQLEEELKEADKKIQQRDMVGEKALAAYKKKAQTSMSIANARTAAAIQAKEDAEMDSQGARSAAEEALQRAKEAEATGIAALAEAKEYVKEMEEERSGLVQRANDALEELENVRNSFAESMAESEAARASKDRLSSEIQSLHVQLQQERNHTSELQQEVRDFQKRSNDLYEEVETLRDELRKKATVAFMTKSQNGFENSEASTNGDVKTGLQSVEKSEAESTIIMLQRELMDSNQAIKELKETLRVTIEHHPQRSNVSDCQLLEAGTSAGQGTGPEVKLAGAPLFYAMEKQAELNTARSEINRLANLLGDAQSEKMEAYEAMQEMRKSMEEAEARLRRYEKLGLSNPRKLKTPQSMLASSGSVSPKRRLSEASSDNCDEIDSNSASVNLEYLKNVMMSFFNAKTLVEKKALLPVVASVLCLTPEEQGRAMFSIESSGSLENAGISLFENFGTQLGFKLV